MKDCLQQAREVINEVDAQMAELFEKRMAAVQQVLAYKKEHNLPILDAAREQIVIEKGVARIQDPVLKAILRGVVNRRWNYPGVIKKRC